ncbi:hypothetical protein LOR91_03540 [Staphylococcus aureus]|nr:hypothetical protein [Staphylococcus aureus]MCF0291105.1 hypothetical protein [Staphylococcus aureus]MCF0310324.1 hypothetical protein [Staphylococcus aureus]MCF0312954.1 hypothetical protein [Staphylococcus aureus]MCJ8004761.1 hypothetical protein [Staphylococcus aureus]MCJ8096206.1 hypothetical protein [Staphylococcus aureus]
MQRNDKSRWHSNIWRSSDIQEAKRNKCIQCNNTCKRSSIIRRSSDIQQAKQNKCI